MIFATLLAIAVFSTFRELRQIITAILQFFGAHAIFPGFTGVDIIPPAFQPTFDAFHHILIGKYFGWEILFAIGIGALSAAMASFRYIHSTIRKQ